MKRVVLLLLCTFLFIPSGYSQESASPPTHTVQAGETLYRIALQYDLSVDELRRLNNLQGNTIRIGQVLVVGVAVATQEVAVPSSPEAQPSDSLTEDPKASIYGTYVVKPGDTFYTISQRYGVPVDTLWVLNGQTTGTLVPGTTLWLPPEFATFDYRVRQGDTLSRIARERGTSVAALRRVNDLRSDRIAIGQVLRVPTAEAPAVREAGALPPVVAEGRVLLFPPTFEGRLTASGHVYEPARFMVSHTTLELGTFILLSNPNNGRSTFAEVVDRGPFDEAFIMDISPAVDEALGLSKEHNEPEERNEMVQVRLVQVLSQR